MKVAAVRVGTASCDPGATASRMKLPRIFSSDPHALANVRASIAAGNLAAADAFDCLIYQADRALRFEPVSVMAKRRVAPSGDKHDYMSLAPYWWPDGATPDGLPYIRKDGQINPELHTVPDKDHLDGMSANVYTLALAYYLKGDERYAEHAAELVRVWFLSPDSKMNPNLRYGQAVRGVTDGRAQGVIETRVLVQVVDAIGMLADYEGWTPADQQTMVKWYTDYVVWMTTDPIAKEEQAATNNHGTWFDVQFVTFLLFIGQTVKATMILEESKLKRIASQIEPNGEQPLETSRADGWHYTVFNLQAFFALATLGDRVRVDLWNYSTPDGRSIRQALDYMVRFIGDEPWPHSCSCDRNWAEVYDLLRQAATHYHAPPYRQLSDRVMAVDSASARINLLLPTKTTTNSK